MKKPSPLAEALVETAHEMHAAGIMDGATHEKITLRHLGKAASPTATPITGMQIRAMRERANLSQAAFARYLNLTAGYVSQLERGVKRPTGAALTLFSIIERKGIEAVL